MLLDRVQHHVDAIYHDNPLQADLDGLAEENVAGCIKASKLRLIRATARRVHVSLTTKGR